MGEKAAALFDEANRAGGMVAKMRLASLAHTTSAQAASLPDTDELLAKLQAALAQVQAASVGNAAEAPTAGRVGAGGTGAREAATLRRHMRAFLDMMTQRALFLGDVDKCARHVVEAAAGGLDVARASVWSLDAERTKIRCVDLYERAGDKHSSGIELFAKDFPAYFAALQTERTIAAHDAHVDPRTSCFSQPYLAPLGIASMLDVPIWVNGRMTGVLCCEHVGRPRTWTEDDETTAYLLSTFVALAHERAAR